MIEETRSVLFLRQHLLQVDNVSVDLWKIQGPEFLHERLVYQVLNKFNTRHKRVSKSASVREHTTEVNKFEENPLSPCPCRRRTISHPASVEMSTTWNRIDLSKNKEEVSWSRWYLDMSEFQELNESTYLEWSRQHSSNLSQTQSARMQQDQERSLVEQQPPTDSRWLEQAWSVCDSLDQQHQQQETRA